MMSDEKTAEKENEVPEQKVWPIMLVGFALAGFGFYFVFAGDSAETEAANVASVVDTVEPVELDGSEEGTVALEYRGVARTYSVKLDQNSKRAGVELPLRTTLSFELVETPADAADGEAFALRRSFRNVAVTVRSGDEVTGKDVTSEVVRLLEATKLDLGYSSSGELLRTHVVSAESAQLRPTLDLVSDALRQVFPSMPAEPVNVGEGWSIRFPAEVEGADFLEVEGSTELSSEVRSTDGDRVLIAGTIVGSMRTTWDDAEARRGHLETEVTGDATWMWNVKKGAPVQVRYESKRVTRTPDGEERETATIRITADWVEAASE